MISFHEIYPNKLKIMHLGYIGVFSSLINLLAASVIIYIYIYIYEGYSKKI